MSNEVSIREQLKDELFSFIDTIATVGNVSVSKLNGPIYGLALLLFRFFDVDIIPYDEVSAMNSTPRYYSSLFIFSYYQHSDSIHITSVPGEVHYIDHGTIIKSREKLKEEISEYINSNSDDDINQMYFYMFLSSF